MQSKRVVVIGLGYVGLVTAAGFADLGNEVVGIDVDPTKVAALSAGQIPIYEPGLEELVRRNAAAGRLAFTTSYTPAVGQADVLFIAVATPSGPSGEADLRFVRAAATALAAALADRPVVIVNKSTVPIGTGDIVSSIVARHRPNARFAVVSNPEFLREGAAVHDFLHPERVVLGADAPADAAPVAELYRPLGAPLILTDRRTAEMIKYASNAFLATKISFINEMAAICAQLGADVAEVARGMGLDPRIGPAFLAAGLGFGGSCLPKDVRALAHMAALHGCHPQLLRAVLEINHDQRRLVVQRLREHFGSLDGRRIGLLGLAFKPNTDDLREAPSLELIHLLEGEGASVRAYDPAAMPPLAALAPTVTLAPDPYACAAGVDALVLVTEWNEFKQLDLARLKAEMRQPVLVDARNLYDPPTLRALGFTYFAFGRPVPRPEPGRNGTLSVGQLGDDGTTIGVAPDLPA